VLSNLSENMTSATPGNVTEGSGKVEKTTAGILRPNIVSYKSKYSYDAIGNILTKTQAVNGGESSLSCNDTYTYGGKQPHAVTKAGAMVFTYDDNGNMIKRENTETKNTMTLVWDDENRLIKTTDSLHTTDYRYDANGERIIKKSELGETQYVSANYIVRNKTVISKHIFAGNQRVASTVSMKDNCGTVSEKNTMYFHPDHLGSSSYVTDKKGNFFEMIEYLPYGETLYDEAATVDKTEFRFTSKEMDAETGLYYYGARYYDARTSRWISTDPILESYLSGKPSGGVYNPGNINLYTYCWGNPVKYIDPDGKYVGVDDLIATGGGLIVGLAARGIGDWYNGEISPWEDYVGAGLGGALTGELLLYTGPVIAGASGAFVANGSSQVLKHFTRREEFSATDLAIDTAVGGATGMIPGIKIKGITSGRGSYNQIYKQMMTKQANNQIAGVSFKTGVKMFTGRAVDTNLVFGSILGTRASDYVKSSACLPSPQVNHSSGPLNKESSLKSNAQLRSNILNSAKFDSNAFCASKGVVVTK